MAVWQQVVQSRAELVVCTGRLLLASIGLVAVWLDPSQPQRHVDNTYGLLALYVIYAAAAVFMAWRARSLPAYWGIATHIADLTVTSMLMYLTEGPTSPFFVFFTFALLAGTLRWQWRGSLWTAVAALFVLLLLGTLAGKTLAGEEFELNRLIIRMVYLAVAAGLLTYVGLHHERVQERLWALSTGTQSLWRHPDEPERDAVSYAAAVFAAPRVLMAWYDEDEPWLQLAYKSRTGFTRNKEAPSRYEPLVAEPLAAGGLLCADVRDHTAATVSGYGGTFITRRGAMLHPGLVERYRMIQVLSFPLVGEGMEGRLFILDRPGSAPDDLPIGEVVAGQIATRMDIYALALKLRAAAVAEERLRFARDLHDGVLQMLTGTALQLQTLRSEIPAGAGRTRLLLESLQETIVAEQQGLRDFIRQLRPGTPMNERVELRREMAELADRLRRRWNCALVWNVVPEDVVLSQSLTQAVTNIVAESAANARRHGNADRVEVNLQVEDDTVSLVILDNGTGFPFRGRLGQDELAARGVGPVSLSDRIANLGGALIVESGPDGARLEISLPREVTADVN
jgi:signal transduction histidine kinase